MPEMEIKWREVAHAQIPVSRQSCPSIRYIVGGAYVDDDGDAVGQREIRAEFPFYDVEILFMRVGHNTRTALTIDCGASLGCSGGRQGPRSDVARPW